MGALRLRSERTRLARKVAMLRAKRQKTEGGVVRLKRKADAQMQPEAMTALENRFGRPLVWAKFPRGQPTQ